MSTASQPSVNPSTTLLITGLLGRYRAGSLEAAALLQEVRTRAAANPGDTAWILRFDAATVDAQLRDLSARFEAAGRDWPRFPLYGIPFAIKDNIDFAGQPTTAACPEFAYTPTHHATAVQRLLDAGAICIGKTNLDQFATGLNGTRSPYGAVPNSFNPAYVSGGSSAGSATVVARGLVSFSLGTDTAGSGRVPAGFNNIVGLKPTKGALSTHGVVPACRSLDCVSIFALTCDDARAVYEAAAGYDAADIYSRQPVAQCAALPAALRIGVPAQPEFCGDAETEKVFDAAVARAVGLGATVTQFDLAPFLEVARLLYDGPWVAERYAAIDTLFEAHPEVIHPVVRTVIAKAKQFDAVAAFKAAYRLEELRRATEPVWRDIDVMLVPTSPTIYTIAQMLDDPVQKNSDFGVYTNFVNLLDYAALAVPAAMRGDGLPSGVTLIAPAWSDRALCAYGARWQADTQLPLGATAAPFPVDDPVSRFHSHSSGSAAKNGSQSQSPRPPVASGLIRVAVVGAHLTGMPLNHQLTTRGARLVAAVQSSPNYRLYALPGTVPPKPGLARVIADAARADTGTGTGTGTATGTAIAMELWDMPLNRFGEFVADVSAPLGIGNVELEGGAWVKGFICEPCGIEGAQDISAFGGWKNFLASKTTG